MQVQDCLCILLFYDIGVLFNVLVIILSFHDLFMILVESLNIDYQYIKESHKIKEIIRSPLKIQLKNKLCLYHNE